MSARFRIPPIAIFAGGIIAGTLDLIWTFGYAAAHGSTAMIVLQTISSGVLGKAAFDGGITSALLGLLLHYLLAVFWASVFAWAAGHSRWIRGNAILSGLLFGVLVFIAMRYVAMPLSLFPQRPNGFKILATAYDLLSHMVFFGVPISLACKFLPHPSMRYRQ